MFDKSEEQYLNEFVRYHSGAMSPEDAAKFRELEAEKNSKKSFRPGFLKLFFDNYFADRDIIRPSKSIAALAAIALSVGQGDSQNKVSFTLTAQQCNWLPECPKSMESQSATVEFRQIETGIEVSVTGFLVGKFQSKLALNWYDPSGTLLYRSEAQNEFVPVMIVTGPNFPIGSGIVDVSNRFEDENGVVYFVLARLTLV